MEPEAIKVIKRILSETPKNTLTDPSLTPAGVLLLLYPKDGEYCILLNKRTDQVEHHKGEISFPGGRKDEGDKSSLDTALRETHEEMGIRPEDVELLGDVDDMPTRSRFLVSTHVGTIPYPYEFSPSEAEVAEVLEVPISRLMDEDCIREQAHLVDGQVVRTTAYAYEGHLIFGATARILDRFLGLLNTAPEKEAVWRTN